jgi:hypothetical protein
MFHQFVPADPQKYAWLHLINSTFDYPSTVNRNSSRSALT